MSPGSDHDPLHEAGRRLGRQHAGMAVLAALCVFLLLDTFIRSLSLPDGQASARLAASLLADARLPTMIAAALAAITALMAIRGQSASRRLAEAAQAAVSQAQRGEQNLRRAIGRVPAAAEVATFAGDSHPRFTSRPPAGPQQVEERTGHAGDRDPCMALMVPPPIDLSRCCEAQERALFLARHDGLTGLANRHHFLDGLEDQLASARRTGGGLAVLSFNLRNFKLVNETHGHEVADALLATLGERLRLAGGPAGIGARLGGDTFALAVPGAVAIPGISGEQAAERLARRLGRVLTRMCRVGKDDFRIELWIGAVLFSGHDDTAGELLQRAESALQVAKAGRRQAPVVFSPAMHAGLQERAAMERDMRSALDEERFHLAYQPNYALRGGAMLGVECLLRWDRPGHGPVPPDRFIPLAEETGLIVPLGAWVLREACRQAACWRAEGLPGFRVAVNLSVIQFGQSDIVEMVERTLRRTGLPAGHLELEITESVVMDDVERALDVIERLRALGVRMALDDFGTGYSSLAYLQRFPFDRLKIDRSFVAEIDGEGPARSIVTAIVQLAHTLEMDVVGEGVETATQLHQLRQAGCDSAQGWLFARPCPPERIVHLARDRRSLVGAV